MGDSITAVTTQRSVEPSSSDQAPSTEDPPSREDLNNHVATTFDGMFHGSKLHAYGCNMDLLHSRTVGGDTA
jgi:hypothetical protein